MTAYRLIVLKSNTIKLQQLPNSQLRRTRCKSVLNLIVQQLLCEVGGQLSLFMISFHFYYNYQTVGFYYLNLYLMCREIISLYFSGVLRLARRGAICLFQSQLFQNRKILYKIIDSKRTMKNSKKKDNKLLKKTNEITKKPPPLQFTQPINTQQFNEGALLKTLLPSASSKLMQGFSTSQKKIISEQFGKMIKTLKIKLTSPDKMQNSNRSKFETKTQRFQYPDPNSRQTVKKTITTERKYPNTKAKIQNKSSTKDPALVSPKKSTRNHSSQLQYQECRSSQIGSPIKKKKLAQNKKVQKIKRKKTCSQNGEGGLRNENYLLMGDTFFEIDEKEIRDIQIGMDQQDQISPVEPDVEIQQVWKQFLGEKKKINTLNQDQKYHNIISKPLRVSRSRQQISNQDSQSVNVCDEYIKSAHESQCTSQIIQRNLITFKESPQKEKLNSKLFYDQFYNNLNQDNQQQGTNFNQDIECKVASEENNSNLKLVPDLQQLQSEQSAQSSYLANSPVSKSQSPYEQTVKARISAISLQMKTNQEILNRLFAGSKIDKKQYQKYMDIVIEIYDREMTEADKLREIIDKNQQRIDDLIKSTNEGLRMSEKLEDVEVEALLGNVLGGYGKNQENVIGLANGSQDKSKQEEKFLEFDKSNVYEAPIQKLQSKTQTPKSSHPHFHNSNIKTKIEQRLACQLGILQSSSQTQKKQSINTSILSAYQFIKNFYTFLTSYHLDEFLMYVNMPYGYSVEQRLRYMQGYDDDEEETAPGRNQIVYGLEEVIRPALLEMYYKSFIFESEQKKDGFKMNQCQKLHNRAIFDAINEAINKFRPYYLINGCPYQWTTTQKALTYYFIRQDCYEQLLQKVQVQVLKWSSSLCGLIIQYPCTSSKTTQDQTISIEQIFQKYTIETPTELLQQRQQKIIKQQKIEAQQTNFEWSFFDEFKTALLYEISSCILEDLANQCSLMMAVGCQLGMGDVLELIKDCGFREDRV